MAYLYSVILLTLCLANTAFAELPVQRWSGAINGLCSFSAYPFTSAQGTAAAAAIACRNAITPTPPNPFCTLSSYDGVKVYGSCDGGIYHLGNMPTQFYCSVTDSTVVSLQTPCPVNCPAGQTSVNGQCQKSEGCKVGLPQRGSIPFPGSPAIVCFSGCEADIVEADNGWWCTGGGISTQCTVGTWVQNGASCQAGTPSASAAPPQEQQCSPGTCPGTVNGITTCLACTQNNTTTSTGTSTSTSSDGSKTTTTTTTECQGDACTKNTTTTTTPAGGGTPTVDSKTEAADDKKSFCEENPTFTACLSSQFGGSCGSFSCDGDAIQCAIAREQHNRNCTLFDTVTPLSTLGEKVANGIDDTTGAARSPSATREVVNLQSTLDTSKFLTGGCPSDRIFSFYGGTTITLPFASLCSYLQFMGSIIVAFAMLGASRIVGVV